MATTLNVSRLTLREFLSTAAKGNFLIPEYQRPYAWGKDEINTLFDDLKDFTFKRISGSKEENYFLGSIVYFINENNEKEIIDGQQRITSILLLLRAIYKILESSETKTPEEENFINQIEPLIWKKDELSGKADKEKILINSRVVTDLQNESFHMILKTGETNKEAKDRYSNNYETLSEIYKEFRSNEPMKIFHFINSILNYTIILPIEADTQDTALTIFSTLNDRGMPLNDADIFKAKIYEKLPDAEAKRDFIDRWRDLEGRADKCGINMKDLFYVYMFYLRAQKDDKDSTTPQLRWYLTNKENIGMLLDFNLLDKLEQFLQILKFCKDFVPIDGEEWSKNIQIMQKLDILSEYQHEWWKYPVCIYYLCHKNSENFESDFVKFLEIFYVKIFEIYSLEHTINSLKSPILKLNAKIIKSSKPEFEFKILSNDDRNNLRRFIKTPHQNTLRGILKFLSYNYQSEILNKGLEIDHIFPQKYEITYDTNRPDMKELIKTIGNLTLFEKKLNVKASNDFFSKKKSQYIESQVAYTRKLCELTTFNSENIDIRNTKIINFIEEKFLEIGKL